jgi:tetratricopeptide (TPR) repeat protein
LKRADNIISVTAKFRQSATRIIVGGSAVVLILLFISADSAFSQNNQVKDIVKRSIDLMHEHRTEDALRLLQQGVRDYPQSGSIHLELGNALAGLQRYDEAISEYQLALQFEPTLGEALLNIASAYRNAKEPAKAVPYYQRFLQEHSDSPMSTQVEAQMLTAAATDCMEHERAYDAKKMLEHAVSMSPHDEVARFKLARARDELGDTQGAIEEYKEVLAIQPDFYSAIFNIAGCYQSMGDLPEAVIWFKKYLKLNPTASDASTVQHMIATLEEKKVAPDADPHGPDFLSSVTQHGKVFRWPLEKMPLRVFIEDGHGCPGFQDSFTQYLIDAFNNWSQATQGRLTFLQVANPNQADIICSWTGNPYDVGPTGSDVEQGICQMNSVERSNENFVRINRANVRILTVDRETHKSISDDDMKKTTLHELGHALGLRGHSPNNHDIMFFSVSPTVWPVLSKRDKATLERVYEN